jgi:hypothetical protein
MSINGTNATPIEHIEVEDFTPEQRTTWLKTGDMPAKEPPKKDESASSKPAGETIGKKAESGTVEEKPADKRIKQLLAERKADRAQMAKLEKDLEEVRTKGAKPAEEKKSAEPAKTEAPKRPRMVEYLKDGVLDSEKYETAMDKYDTDKEEFRERENYARNSTAEQARLINQWTSDLKQKYSEKADGIDVKATMDKLLPTIKDAPGFAAFLNDSEVFTDLLFIFATDPKLDELIALAKTNPTKAARHVVALELGIKNQLAKNEKAEGSEEKPPEKKITRAGAPPSEVGGRSSVSGDEADAALRRGDGESYRRIMNERDIARRKALRGR